MNIFQDVSLSIDACRLFSRGVIFTHARVSLALLSLRKNGGLLVVYTFKHRRFTNFEVLFPVKATDFS